MKKILLLTALIWIASCQSKNEESLKDSNFSQTAVTPKEPQTSTKPEEPELPIDPEDNDPIDESKIDFSNIKDLYAQPWQVIQKAIQGKWQVVYHEGGIFYHIKYLDNCFVEFTADNKYVSNVYETQQYTTQYRWIKTSRRYVYLNETTPVDSLFVIQLEGGSRYAMHTIYNDTLIYLDVASDPFIYHCIKTTNF